MMENNGLFMDIILNLLVLVLFNSKLLIQFIYKLNNCTNPYIIYS